VSEDPDIAGALSRLDALTRKLRLECPWDREQDERSIVPHTLEEAYELADAAHARDDSKLIDELGDVLFQVHFLALLLEERDAGNLADVAEHCTRKLIHRHPHVFGETEVADAAEVLRNWDQIKSTEPGREAGIFGEVPENLPALLYARKLQRRASSAGRGTPRGVSESVGTLRDELARLESTIAEGQAAEGDRPSTPTPTPAPASGPASVEGLGEPGVSEPVVSPRAGVSPSEGESARPQAFEELGDVLFAMVTVARELKLDPELALRAAAQRFRESLSEEKAEP
jgi:MazG family protein